MKPAEYPTGHYLIGTVQLHVPAYQRPYSWGNDRLVDLWRDVAHQYRNSGKLHSDNGHFMGALILERIDSASTTSITAVNVIDGQQRLLTKLVLLAAIRDHIHHQTNKKVRPKNNLSEIKPQYGKVAPRVLAKRQDQPTLDAILRGQFINAIDDARFDHALSQAYRFFRHQLWIGRDSITKHTLNLPPRPLRGKSAPPRGDYGPWGAVAAGRKAIDLPLLQGVITGSLKLLELMLEDKDEEAGVIFETMNAKGTPLRQFDLLRNSIFVRMPKSKDAFHQDIWQHLETLLAGVTYSALRDKAEEQFLYEYVIATGEAGVSRDSLHRRWLSTVIEDVGYAVTARSEKLFRDNYVDPLVKAAFLYPLAVGQKKSVRIEPSGQVSVTDEQHTTIKEIMAMSKGPAVPIVLRGLIDRDAGLLSDTDFQLILLDLQSYLVRLILGGEDFSPLRATMMAVASRLAKPVTVTSVQAALREADWKTDSEVLKVVGEVDTHSWKSAVFFPILRGAERQLSGISAHPMPFGNKTNYFSIEHIYPQTPNIGTKWSADLASWSVTRDAIDARRYALGNLTAVTNYDNRINGRKPFPDKQLLISRTANLKLHDSFLSATQWTPTLIDARTLIIAKAALKRWPRV